MTFTFDCPVCSRSLKAPEGASGRTAECKYCHNKITIPKLESERHSDADANRMACDLISSTVRSREKVPRATILSETITVDYLQNWKEFSPSLQRGIWLYECRLLVESQLALVEFLTQQNIHPLEKSAAMYLLGVIGFEQNHLRSAYRIWKMLSEEFPDSHEGKIVVDRLDELCQTATGDLTEYIDDARASMYLKNGDYWTNGQAGQYVLDTSYINNIEAAVYWYDKSIEEFPGTAAARSAYERKLRTLIGWKNPNDFGMAYGAMGEYSQYMPEVLEAFAAFEKSFPDAPSLQPIRFQIAQLYWTNKDFVNTEHWLRQVIEKGKDQDAFYADLATRRLRKLSASI